MLRLLLFLLIPGFGLEAQTTTPRLAKPVNLQPAAPSKRFDQYVTTTDMNGRPFQNPYADVEGHPYTFEDYRFATVTLNKGAVYEKLKVKIDVHDHAAHFIAEDDKKEIIAEEGLISEIILTDTVNGELVYFIFRTGYPPVDTHNSKNFYQVLTEGNIQLLKFIKKEIVETKDVMSGEVRKEFKEYDTYYTYRDGIMKSLKKDRDFVLDLMKDHQPEISEYLKGVKMNFKNAEMFTRLFAYYNTLLHPF